MEDVKKSKGVEHLHHNQVLVVYAEKLDQIRLFTLFSLLLPLMSLSTAHAKLAGELATVT